MSNLSPEYRAALATHDAALQVYQEAVTAYRSRVIGDAEFLAARKVKLAADAAFDAAFDEEQLRGGGE